MGTPIQVSTRTGEQVCKAAIDEAVKRLYDGGDEKRFYRDMGAAFSWLDERKYDASKCDTAMHAAASLHGRGYADEYVLAHIHRAVGGSAAQAERILEQARNAYKWDEHPANR